MLKAPLWSKRQVFATIEFVTCKRLILGDRGPELLPATTGLFCGRGNDLYSIAYNVYYVKSYIVSDIYLK